MDFLNEDNYDHEDDNDNNIEKPIKDKNDEDLELEEIENNLEDWVDDEEDDQIEFKSLFDDTYYPTVDLLVAHDLDLYNFNLKRAVKDYANDDISIIKLINFIRLKVSSITYPITSAYIDDLNSLLASKSFLEGDVYMKPTLDNDPLLYMYEDALLTIQDEDLI